MADFVRLSRRFCHTAFAQRVPCRRCALRLFFLLLPLLMLSWTPTTLSAQAQSTSSSATSSPASSGRAARSRSTLRRKKKFRHHASPRRIRRYRQAFVSSTELRPMAEQLVATRTPAAFAGVTAYARRHQGDPAATAWLALGYAYLQEGRFSEAVASLRAARSASDTLVDYDEFLEARAEHLLGHQQEAASLLTGFAARHSESIFDVEVPELLASVLLAEGDPTQAARVLAAAPASAGRRGYQLAQAQVAEALNHPDAAALLYRHVLVAYPLSSEAGVARARITALGMDSVLTPADEHLLADAYYRAHRYAEAATQYRALAHAPGLSADIRDSDLVAAAACDLHLKRLTQTEAEALPTTGEDSAARRLYLLMELARDRDDEAAVADRIGELQSRFPHSPWLAEALFSAANMNLLSRDYPQATSYYSRLATSFPSSDHAPAAHWRAGWLSYRQGLYSQADQLFEQQIQLYPAASETVSALYWRARIAESHQPDVAAQLYRSLIANYTHYFYAQMARQRLTAMGQPETASTDLPHRSFPIPHLDSSIPDDDPHLLKASLLINAGLAAFVPLEIAAVPDSGSWGAIAEAQLYASYGENFRALRIMKRALPFAASAPIAAIPYGDWRILFPEPYWSTILSESAKNKLDPYLVVSLIRQESEFNPGAISGANAFGLMQLLPSVGRQMAREEGLGPIATRQLLDPILNIRLGTRYLRQLLDHFGNVPEYALAAYNAGENRVTDWQSAGPYSGMDEFVESIPFTETRGYVESILRNQEVYRELDLYSRKHAPDSRADSTAPLALAHPVF